MTYFYVSMKLCNDDIFSYVIHVRAPELDMSELESLFSASAPNSNHGGASGKTNRLTSGLKSDKVHLVKLMLFLSIFIISPHHILFLPLQPILFLCIEYIYH